MTISSTKTKTIMIEDPNPGAGTLYVHGESVTPTPVTWEEIVKVSLLPSCNGSLDGDPRAWLKWITG